MASLYAHTAWSSGNLAVDACTPEARGNCGASAAPASRSGRRHAGGPKRSRHLGAPASRNGRRHTSGPRRSRHVNAPAAQSGRRHVDGSKRSRRVSGIGRSRHPASLARHLRLCGNGRSFLDFPEESDEMTWHFSPAPSRGPILIWETAGRLIAVKRSTLRSSFLPRHFDSAN